MRMRMSEFLGKIGRGAAWTIGSMKPIEQNKIVISSFFGKGYGDNLRPIAEELMRRRKCGSPLISRRQTHCRRA